MKPVTTAIVLLLALPTACGGAVETDASKNAEVIGVVGEGDGDDAPANDDPSSDGGSDDESTTGSSGNQGDPNEQDEQDEPGNDDGVDEQDDDSDGDAPSDEDDGGGERASAVALTRAQLDALRDAEPEGGTTSATTGGDLPALDPADLFLKISDMGTSCDVAYTSLACGGHWSLSIALPPEYQAVGVYDLADSKISQYSMMSETTEPYSTPDDCGWGGGTIGGGTIEVLAIDQSEVRFRVDMQSAFLEANPNGEYTAIRCP